MKEHRDPPPFAAGEPRIRPAALSAPEPLALPSPRPRPLSGRILARSWPILLLIALLGAYLTYLGARAARSWLARQPAYQLPFRAIRLEPPPPSWYRGGAEAFLEDVRRRGRMPETLPLLGLKKDDVRRAFENSPWIREVQEVEYIPLGLTVRLIYRRPVAIVWVEWGREKYLVDESAVILPLGDWKGDLESLAADGGLITIKGEGLLGPLDPTPGLAWKPRPAAHDAAPGNELIPAAVQLAHFLQEKMRSVDRIRKPALDFRFINPMDSDRRGLFLWNARLTTILWGEAPGEESPGHLKAEEKWGKLVDWSPIAPNEPSSRKEYWEITPTGVKYVDVADHPSPQATRNTTPRRDRQTVPAKGPGQSRDSPSH